MPLSTHLGVKGAVDKVTVLFGKNEYRFHPTLVLHLQHPPCTDAPSRLRILSRNIRLALRQEVSIPGRGLGKLQRSRLDGILMNLARLLTGRQGYLLALMPTRNLLDSCYMCQQIQCTLAKGIQKVILIEPAHRIPAVLQDASNIPLPGPSKVPLWRPQA